MSIPKCDDLVALSKCFQETLGDKYDLSTMEIVFSVDELTLNKINEDLYYRNNTTGAPDETDEIVVNINGYTFKYVNNMRE